MARNLFTEKEIVLCTYLAIYETNTFIVTDINKICNRPVSSIKMKIQNIAAMLDEENITRYSTVKGLSGVTSGAKGRRTNWNWIEVLLDLSQANLLSQCETILNE